jgi:GNAT superfamily N-acetyltransferase
MHAPSGSQPVDPGREASPPGLRQATPGDLHDVVALHAAAFPGFFLTRLGPKFLAELYRAFVERPDSICLVAYAGSTLLGVVAGPVKPGAFFGELVRERGAAFARAAIPGLLRDPWHVVRRLLAAPFYRGEAPAVPDAALVSTICVAPVARRTGLATALLESFSAAALAQGARHVYLTTDRDDNDRVNTFYARAGFVLESQIRRSSGRVMNRYIKELSR